MTAVQRAVASTALDMASESKASPEGEEGCTCELNRKTWPNLLTGLGIGVGAGVVVCGVNGLAELKISDGKSPVIDIYLIVLGAFGVIAEARRFKFLRPFLYLIVKHAYFITNYTARSAYYLFLATITFDPSSALAVVIGIYAAAVAVALFTVNLIYKLPEYLDAAEAKKRMEEQIRREVEARYQAEAAAARREQFGGDPSRGLPAPQVPTPHQGLINQRERVASSGMERMEPEHRPGSEYVPTTVASGRTDQTGRPDEVAVNAAPARPQAQVRLQRARAPNPNPQGSATNPFDDIGH